MNVEERVKKVIASQLNVSIDTITNTTSLTEDLGADSLDTVEIIMAMEDEFQQIFSDETIKIVTVQDIFDTINRVVTEAN
ncbi:MAG TPA: acyl carrier protein [Gammaproteobacteria bacterium]|nr:acyl carrier protein [Gammaproteobacteria bacterium]